MASLYWVGSTATWDATAGTKWATSSGGAGGATAPTAADDVFFDGNSGAGTVALASSSVARSVNCTGFTGTISHPAATTLTIGDGTAGAGDIALEFTAGMTYTLGNATTSAISFVSTSATAQTVNFAGKTSGNVTYDGTGGSWKLTGAHNMASAATCTHNRGVFDFNGQTVNWGAFSSVSGLARTIVLGTGSSITLTRNAGFDCGGNTTGLSVTSGTETTTLTASGASFSTSTQAFNAVIFNGGGNSFIQCNVASLTWNGTADKLNQISAGTVTVRTSLTITGNSLINRVFICTTNGIGAVRTWTVNASSVSLSNIDWQDMAITGSAAPLTGTSMAQAGGSSGITFAAAVTRYVVAAGNWSSTTIWATTSGGASGASVPLCQDNVVLDGNSGVGTITGDMPRLSKDLTCTGYTGTLSLSSLTTMVCGSFTLSSGMTFSQGASLQFHGRGTHTVTCAGKLFGTGITFFAAGGSYTFQDSFSCSGQYLVVNSGTVNTNNQAVTCGGLDASGNTARTFTFGTSTITMDRTGSGNIVAFGNSLTTISAASATFIISAASSSTRTFVGGGNSYGTLTYTVAGSTGPLAITGANTFGTINFKDTTNARTLTLPASTTTTITNAFNVVGTATKLITVNSSASGTAATLSKSSGVVSCDYLSLQDSTATGGATWYAGANSTIVSNVTGWTTGTAPLRYWVGSTATWDATAGTKWSVTSGGSGGYAVPTVGDNVFFDSNSGTGTITLSSSSTARSINCTGFTGTISHPAATTISIGDGTAGTGNVALKLVAGMTYTKGDADTSAITFASTSSTVQTIDVGGKTLGNVTLNGAGNAMQLSAAFLQASTSTLTLTNGTLDTNGQTCTLGTVGLGSGTKTLTLGASVITVVGSSLNLNTNAGGLTFNAGTSSITLNPTASVTPSFSAGTQTYYDVSVIKSAGGFAPSGSPTFHNLTMDNTVVGGGNRILQFDAGGTITITGALTYKASNATSSRGRMVSNTVGATTTIALGSTGTAAITDADFEDVVFTGTNTPITPAAGRFGNGGGNAGITFASPVTYYWIGNGGSMTDVNKYSLSSGGSASTVVPLIHDVLVFDANSITSSSQTIANDMMRMPSLTFTNVLNNPVYNPKNPNGAGNTIYGNLIMKAGMTVSATGAAGSITPHVFRGRGSQSIDQAGIDFLGAFSANFVSPGGSYTFLSDFNGGDSAKTLILSNGTLNANGKNVSAGLLSSSNANTRTMNMGSGTWTLTGTGTVWQTTTVTNLTFNAGTSTLAITDVSSSSKTIAAGGRTFNNLTVTGGGSGAVIISSGNTFNNFTVGAPKTITFSIGTANTFTGNVVMVGSAGNVITINSNTPGTAATVSKASGLVNCDYLSLQDSTATGGATWNAGANSTTVSNVTGWAFSSAAMRYWVGGTATWDATAGTKWALASGGAGGYAVPTASDNVFFDTNSGANTVTLSNSSVARSIDCASPSGDFTGTLVHNATTLAIGDGTAGVNNVALRFSTAMTYNGNNANSILNFVSSSTTTQDIDSKNKTFRTVAFNGSGGSWQLTSGMTNASVATVTMTAGTLNTNGQSCSWGLLALGVGTKTLTLGSSAITITGTGTPWNFGTNATGLTFNANTSTITFTSGTNITFSAGALTYYNVAFTAVGTKTTTGAFTCNNLTLNGGAGQQISWVLQANVVINGTFTSIATNSASAATVNTIAPVLFTTASAARNITAGAVSFQNTNFHGINALGAAIPWTGTNMGDGLGNANITFDSSRTLYWVGAGASWNTLARWSLSSGGSTGVNAPLPQDDVIFDANSITSTGQTIQANSRFLGRNINMSGILNSPNMTLSGLNAGITGNLVLGPGMTTTLDNITALSLLGNGANQQLTTNGVLLQFNLNFSPTGGGTWVLQDDLTVGSTNRIVHSIGTIDANNKNVSCGLLNSSNSNTRTISMGSGTWSLTGNNVTNPSPAVLDMGTVTNLTLNAQTSTLAITDTTSNTKTAILPVGKTLNNVSITAGGTGAVILEWQDTLSGRSGTINGLTISGPKTVTFAAGQTTNLTTLQAVGTAGNLITLNSLTSGSQFTLSKTSDRVVADYLSLQDSNATGGAQWYAGNNSVNVSNNTGWIFGVPFIPLISIM